MDNETKYTPIIVFITTPSHEAGRQIAEALVQQRLAACVNIISPIQSLYIWEGKLNDEQEALLIVKSRAELFDEHLVPAIKAVHPYEVPEIIALPILMGSQDYLAWIDEGTTP